MQRTDQNSSPLEGVTRAPFSYLRRRAVWESPQTRGDAARAVNAVLFRRRGLGFTDATAALQNGLSDRCVSSPLHNAQGQPAECSRAEAHFPQACPNGCANHLSSSVHQAWASPLPQLEMDPLPPYLLPLRYVRSTRSWDAIASGCIEEAKHLSEADNDVLAWAVSFILSGDPQEGLLLLESYVIATCALLFERDLGHAPPTSKHPSFSPTPWYSRRRHNRMLRAWLHYRTRRPIDATSPLQPCSVDPKTVSEETVRRVVLRSMQLMDEIEVKRWYAVALMLCTPALSNGDDRESAELDDDERNPDDLGEGSPAEHSLRGGGKSYEKRDLSSAQRAASCDPVFDKGDATTATALSCSVYEVPSNLWFRYFFAFCESSPADDAAESTAAAPWDSASSPVVVHRRGLSNDVFSTVASRVSSSRKLENYKSDPCRSSHAASLLRDDRNEDRGTVQARRASLISSERNLLPPRSASPSLASARTSWARTVCRPLEVEEAVSLLLVQLEEWDVFFITAVTAFQTQHYRSCMMAASRFLHGVEVNGLVMVEALGDAFQQTAPVDGGATAVADGAATQPAFSLTRAGEASGLQSYQCHLALFVRAWSSMQVGERLQFGEDVLSMLAHRPESLRYHVGCALALYGMPLPTAKEAVMRAIPDFVPASDDPCCTPASTTRAATGPTASPINPFTVAVQRYLYVLTESVHALTLLRLGLVQPALRVATAALDRTEAVRREAACSKDDELVNTTLLSPLHHVVVLASVALEDASAVLDSTLSPHLLAYIAVSPAFFGGLCAGGIRVRMHSVTHQLLYPASLPMYTSTRQVIPFHMNRAVYLYHAGHLHAAWDDVCCAVAAADDVVGSVEFAFSDCFPLRVYYFACKVGFELMESLLSTDLEVAKAYLSHPGSQRTAATNDAMLENDEEMEKEVVDICRGVVRRMRHFYPHSRTTELCQGLVSVLSGERGALSEAVRLSERYPHSPAAQNLLTAALYFDHHVPEAVDNAEMSLQAFPHSRGVIDMHRILRKKRIVYLYNYRGVLPIYYKPGTTGRVMTLRMGFLMALLLANVALVCLTAYLNSNAVVHAPDSVKYYAVRMQVPSLIPLFFAAIFVSHAVIAAATPKNLIGTTLTDLFFVNTALNRALFSLRCIPLVNVVNAFLVSFAGNNFLFESAMTTWIFYVFLTILFVPFTTRVWLLPSIDEPHCDALTWLAILGVDTVTAFVVLVPHIILAVLEPYMLVLFHFYAPMQRPSSEEGGVPPSSSIRRRLLFHANFHASLPPRFKVGSGSRFIHIRCLRWLYYCSHCSMDTRYLAESQLEADSYRVFPLIREEEAETFFGDVPSHPLCPSLTSSTKGPSTSKPCDGITSPPPPAPPAASFHFLSGLGRLADSWRRSRVPLHPAESCSVSPTKGTAQAGDVSGVHHGPSECAEAVLGPSARRCSSDAQGSGRPPSAAKNDWDAMADTDKTELSTLDAVRQGVRHAIHERRRTIRKSASFIMHPVPPAFPLTEEDNDDECSEADGDVKSHAAAHGKYH